MTWYKRKNVTRRVQAVQFKPGENDAELLAFLDGCKGWQRTARGIEWPSTLAPTITVILAPNDWAVRSEGGEHYWSARPEYFTLVWEPAT